MSGHGVRRRGRRWGAATAAVLAGGFAPLVLSLQPARAATTTAVDHYALSPNPIAAPGSLTTPGTSVVVTVTALDATGSPIGGAPVYLSFTSTATNSSQPGANTGTAKGPDGKALSATPTLYTTASNGSLAVTYTTAAASCAPAGSPVPGCLPPYPNSGADTITAQDRASSPTTAASDSYSYSSTPTGTTTYSWSPTPVAPAGSLAANSSPSSDVVLQVLQNGSRPTGSVQVYVSFSTANGGSYQTDPAWAQTASQSSQTVAGCPPLVPNGSPVPCNTDASGQIKFTYTTGPGQGSGSTAKPTQGRDVITAQNASSNPTVAASDEYDYGFSQYAFTPSPMAATGSLKAGQQVTVTLAVTDATGSKVPQGTTVYLSLTGPRGGAPLGSATATPAPGASPSNPQPSASVGQTPTPFVTDANGTVAVTYRAPATLPSSGGTDTLTAQNGSSTATANSTAADTYTYATPSTAPPPPTGTTGQGYWMVGNDGGTFTFGGAGFFGSMGGKRLNAPIVGMASTPDGRGYWMVGNDGGIFTFGDAGFFGSLGGKRLNAPIVGMASTPDGRGYWMVGSDGGIFTFGDAGFFGSRGGQPLAAPIIAMASSPDGNGYWFAASDGGVFSYGDAPFKGSEGGTRLNSPIVGMAATATGGGYWMVGADGGIFAFGDAGFFGSMGGKRLNAPVVGMAATPDGAGYWMVGNDGGIFTFGDAGFFGSMGGKPLNAPVVGMSAT